ncbi:MAG: hypothetical protein RSE44_11765, partial [Pseudomonas sp.]
QTSAGIKAVYYTYKHNLKEVTYAYKSGEFAYRVTMKRGAINQLVDINTVERAPAVGDLSGAVWTPVAGAVNIQTDYLPPMVVRAVANGDDGETMYTGGSHGSDGSGGGSPTARLVTLAFFADGALIEKDAEGYADACQLMLVNRLMGCNTIATGRYIVQQAFGIELTAAGMDIHSRVSGLEDVTVITENGPQAYIGGFMDTQMLPDSINPVREPLDLSKKSGPREEYPDAWLTLMRSANGTMAAWVDRSFGAGDGRYVDYRLPYIRGGGTKFYNSIVGGIPTEILKGKSYEWRGGFHFFANDAKDGFDTRMAIGVGRKKKVVAVNTDGASFAV